MARTTIAPNTPPKTPPRMCNDRSRAPSFATAAADGVAVGEGVCDGEEEEGVVTRFGALPKNWLGSIHWFPVWLKIASGA